MRFKNCHSELVSDYSLIFLIKEPETVQVDI